MKQVHQSERFSSGPVETIRINEVWSNSCDSAFPAQAPGGRGGSASRLPDCDPLTLHLLPPVSTPLSPVSCGSGGPSLPRPLPLPAAALGWSLGGQLLPPIPGRPRDMLGGVRKAAVRQGPPGSRSNGRLAHISTVCGWCLRMGSRQRLHLGLGTACL